MVVVILMASVIEDVGYCWVVHECYVCVRYEYEMAMAEHALSEAVLS